MTTKSMSMFIHGPTKVGKSTLADTTTPVPRLLMDVESGYRFLPIKPKMWDPTIDPTPPVYDGTWDTCVVITRSFAHMQKAYDILKLGNHPFKSVVIDSISELQVKLKEDLVGRGKMQMQQWGEVLTALTGLLRDLRDLTEHPTQPLEMVVCTAMTSENPKTGKMELLLEGKSSKIAPYLFDVIGFLNVEKFVHPDPTQPMYSARRMYVTPSDDYVAGERVQGKLTDTGIIEYDELNKGLEYLLDKVFATVEVAEVPAEIPATTPATKKKQPTEVPDAPGV